MMLLKRPESELENRIVANNGGAGERVATLQKNNSIMAPLEARPVSLSETHSPGCIVLLCLQQPQQPFHSKHVMSKQGTWDPLYDLHNSRLQAAAITTNSKYHKVDIDVFFKKDCCFLKFLPF